MLYILYIEKSKDGRRNEGNGKCRRPGTKKHICTAPWMSWPVVRGHEKCL